MVSAALAFPLSANRRSFMLPHFSLFESLNDNRQIAHRYRFSDGLINPIVPVQKLVKFFDEASLAHAGSFQKTFAIAFRAIQMTAPYTTRTQSGGFSLNGFNQENALSGITLLSVSRRQRR